LQSYAGKTKHKERGPSKFHFIRSEIRITFPVNIFCNTFAAKMKRQLQRQEQHKATNCVDSRGARWSGLVWFGWVRFWGKGIPNYATPCNSRQQMKIPRIFTFAVSFWLLRPGLCLLFSQQTACRVVYFGYLRPERIFFFWLAFFLFTLHTLAGCQKGNMCWGKLQIFMVIARC